jgi:GNAT superfamily N-acetyltransferase
MAEPKREIVDLREHRDDALLDELYRKLFLPNFPDPDEHEDPGIWAPLLWGDPDESQPVLHALVAGRKLGDREDRALEGFLLCEYYQSSACGLLTYLAIDPESRRQRLGRELFERGVEALRKEAESRGDSLAAVFGEIHDPAKVPASRDSVDPAVRLEVMRKLGGRLIPISYVQPELGPGRNRSDRLLLVVFPTEGDHIDSIGADAIKAFLHEFYVALGVDKPQLDRDYRQMSQELDSPDKLLLVDRLESESPALDVPQYAIALHFEAPQGEVHLARKKWRESDINFRSFEEDILSYSYRNMPPFSSEVVEVPKELATLVLQFPKQLDYEAEGDRVRLRCPYASSGFREREVRIMASRTDFESGISVLHLVLVPGERDGTLNEYDLVKIAKLWEHGEAIDMTSKVTLRSKQSAGPAVSIACFASMLFRCESLREPKLGTVQLVQVEEWKKILESLDTADDKDEYWSKVVGVGGIVQALLDFKHVDPGEVADVFAPLQPVDDGLLGIHKGTLVSVAQIDRVYKQTQETIGMSPYLLLPQAVLLHNELQLDLAQEAAQGAEDTSHWVSLRNAEKRMRHALEVEYLPNIFHYSCERQLYVAGSVSRGLTYRRTKLRGRLEEVSASLQAEITQRREKRDDLRNDVLAAIAAIGLAATIKPLVDDLITRGWSSVLISVAIVLPLFFAYIGFRRRGQN